MIKEGCIKSLKKSIMIDKDKLKQSVSLFLEAIGEDINREGLLETPDRVVRMWEEFESNKEVDVKVFKNPNYDEMVCKVGIEFFSFCEHHLLPFYGTVDIAYIPDAKIVGISKLARVVRKYASRLNIQEKMTNDIADFLSQELSPQGVMVIVKARHLCEMMRGIKNGGDMITSAVRGVFKEKDNAAKAEFLNIR